MGKPIDELREALYSSGLVQPLNATGRGGSLSCVCRQVPGQEKGWIATIDKILKMAEENKIDVHLCRRYVRKDGAMAFGWFLGIEAKNQKSLGEAVSLVAPILREGAGLYVAQAAKAAPEAPAAGSDAVVRILPKNFDLRKFTEATPRAPEFSGPDPLPPRAMVFNTRVRQEGSAEVTEMPLPHVYTKDINKPRPGSNRGAAFQGSNSELFKGIQVKS